MLTEYEQGLWNAYIMDLNLTPGQLANDGLIDELQGSLGFSLFVTGSAFRAFTAACCRAQVAALRLSIRADNEQSN